MSFIAAKGLEEVGLISLLRNAPNLEKLCIQVSESTRPSFKRVVTG
jgi:hypothetical protein